MSRTAATVLAVLLAAACTGRDDPAPPPYRTVLATVDLDAAVGTDVVVHDLAPSPVGPPMALVGAAGAPQSWLVDLDDRAATAVPAVEPGSELVISDDGTPLVVGAALTRAGGDVLPLPLGGPPTAVLLVGETLHLARETRLVTVDVGTGAVRATADAPAPVTHLAPAPDGGLSALADSPDDGVVLLRLGPDLRVVGDPVVVVPERVSTPTALQVTADGTVVVAAYVGAAQEDGRLVTVADGRVRTVADLTGTDDTALDLAVDGRAGYVVLSASYQPAELTAVDLDTGERTAVVGLCGGAGAFGAIVRSADGSTLTVIGSCIDAEGPTTTAFVVG